MRHRMRWAVMNGVLDRHLKVKVREQIRAYSGIPYYLLLITLLLYYTIIILQRHSRGTLLGTRPLVGSGITLTMQHVCLARRFVDSLVDPLKTVIEIDQAEYRADEQSDCQYQRHIGKQLHHIFPDCVGPHSTSIEDDQSTDEVGDKAHVADLVGN